MQIVIDIDEEEYTNIKKALNSLIENGVERVSMSKVCLAILDGTPLPKGHGRIVDIGPYEGKVIASRKYCGVYRLVEVAELDTIIEADKAESEGEYGKI